MIVGDSHISAQIKCISIKAAELGFAEQNENLQIEVKSDSISSTKSVTAYFNTGKVVSK